MRRTPFTILLAAVLLAAGVAAADSPRFSRGDVEAPFRAGPSAVLSDGSQTYSDPVGDAEAGAPDIARLVIAHDEAGTISFAFEFANRASWEPHNGIGVFLNSDDNVGTGDTSRGGIDHFLEAGGEFAVRTLGLRRWTGTSMDFVESPSLRGGWSSPNTFTFSIALTELGNPQRIGFYARTLGWAGGPFTHDHLYGGTYDLTQASTTRPAEPVGVRATSRYPTLIRVSWGAVADAEKYEVWRSSRRGSRGAKIATTVRTYFSDRRAIPGRAYFYSVRASNATGTSPFSMMAVGMRRSP